MPRLPPIEPPQKVKLFAKAMGNCVDAWGDKVPMTLFEVLQGLEWLRYCITESIITENGWKRDDA